MNLNLYHVSQGQNNDYDTYSDFVICCENEEVARNASPNDGEPLTEMEWKCRHSAWCNDPKHVSVRHIGVANENTPAGIVCSSYHAG